MKKIDWFLLIFLGIIIVLTPIILLNPDFASNFDIEKVNLNNYWLVIGFLILVSILGALVPIPIPYILPAAFVASEYYGVVDNAMLKIIGIIFLAALGNAIGDFLDYVIGKGAGHAMEQDQPDLSNKWSQRILRKPKAIPGIIVAFGLTPLPDSLLLVPLGVVKYPMKKTLFWMYIGKIGMFTIVVIAGILSIDPILNLLGEGGDSGGNSGAITGVALLFLMWIIIALMAKWDAIFKKNQDKPQEDPYLAENEDNLEKKQ